MGNIFQGMSRAELHKDFTNGWQRLDAKVAFSFLLFLTAGATVNKVDHLACGLNKDAGIVNIIGLQPNGLTTLDFR